MSHHGGKYHHVKNIESILTIIPSVINHYFFSHFINLVYFKKKKKNRKKMLKPSAVEFLSLVLLLHHFHQPIW